jgi:hypothetical protein
MATSTEGRYYLDRRLMVLCTSHVSGELQCVPLAPRNAPTVPGVETRKTERNSLWQRANSSGR